MTLTAVEEIRQTNKRIGLVFVCVGVGQGGRSSAGTCVIFCNNPNGPSDSLTLPGSSYCCFNLPSRFAQVVKNLRFC